MGKYDWADLFSKEDLGKRIKILESENQNLVRVCQLVVKWAETPGNHGGNPWSMDHVRLADNAVKRAKNVPMDWELTEDYYRKNEI